MEKWLRALKAKEEHLNPEEDSEDGSESSEEELQDRTSISKNISAITARAFRRRGRNESPFRRHSSSSPPDA
jgi:hypothetical protein